MLGFSCLLLLLLLRPPASSSSGMDSLGGNRDIDLFSSTDELRKLFATERRLHDKLRRYLEQTDKQIAALDELLDKHYADYDKLEGEDAAEYVSNPINTYSMLKRTGLHWPMAREALQGDNSTDFANIQDEVGTLPTEQDIQVGYYYMSHVTQSTKSEPKLLIRARHPEYSYFTRRITWI